MNAKEIVEQIKALEPVASLDLETVPSRTLPGMQMAKRDAQEKIATLRDSYREQILNGLLGLFVTGPGASEFARISETEDEIIVVHADELYQVLAAPAEAAMTTSREFGTSQFSHFLVAYGDAMSQIEVANPPSPRFSDGVVLKTHDEVTAHVRNLVREVIGDAANREVLLRSIVKKGLALSYGKSVVPVVVLGVTEPEVEGLSSLFKKGVVNVQTTADVTIETVKEAFEQAKKKLTNTNKKKDRQ